VPGGLSVVAMKMCAVFEMMRCLEVHGGCVAGGL